MKYNIVISIILLTTLTSCNSQPVINNTTKMDSTKNTNPYYNRNDSNKVVLPEEEWKKILKPEVYRIARQKGTEMPFTSKFEKFEELGNYYCAVCGNPLFTSTEKFATTCGWPSFFKPITKSSIIYLPDNSHNMNRTEVQCGKCKSHLGHVFEDGPPPTGLRYCINGAVLDFEKLKENK